MKQPESERIFFSLLDQNGYPEELFSLSFVLVQDAEFGFGEGEPTAVPAIRRRLRKQ